MLRSRALPLPAAAVLLALAAVPADAATVSAGQAEAKDAARTGGCSPAKVDVLHHAPGRTGRTVFKVGCNEEKDSFVIVECRSRVCTLLR